MKLPFRPVTRSVDVKDCRSGFDWTGQIEIAFGTASGSFENPVVTTLLTKDFGDNSFVHGIEIADANGDGRPDIIGVGQNPAGQNVTFSFSIAANNSVEQQQLDAFTPGNHSSMVAGDFNSDGITDILASGAVKLTLLTADLRQGLQPLLAFSLKTQADSLQALSVFKNKSTLLNNQRGMIGSLQSRTNSAISYLGNAALNTATADHRIRDVDLAETSSEYVRTRILQQSAAAVLAQANVQPRLALDLLKL